MSDPIEPRPERRLSEQEARRLLERVIELDAKRAGETSLEELRRVAQELNLSTVAFDQALTELNSGALATPPPPPTEREQSGRYTKWVRTAAIALGGAFFAPASGLAANDIEAWIVVLIAASAALTLYHRVRKTPKAFWADVLALWAGSILYYLNAGGGIGPSGSSIPVSGDYLFALIVGWLASSTLGGWIVKFRWPWKKNPSPKNEFAATH